MTEREGSPKHNLAGIPEPSADPATRPQPFPVVAIGASAGGLQAFRKLLDHLPPDVRMAYVLIPHLDPTHHSLLSELLSRTAKISIQEVEPGMRVEPGHAYVIAPNTIMTIAEDRLQLVPRTALRGTKHHCINHFMVSLANAYREKAIGVILSGTASDGSIGIETIKSEGGVTFAQDDSAEFKDMPRNAIATGAVDFVLPPEGIARELERISRHPYLVSPPPQNFRVVSEGKPANGDLEKTFSLLKGATGVDFTHYKRSTVERRIARRMAIAKIEKLPDYERHLEDNPQEVRILHDELLINVTSFFREPEAFEALRSHVYPSLMKDRAAHDPIRVWVPGCSSGEEVYSIAISLVEFLEERGARCEIQLFGTDISERAVKKARTGVYESGITSEVSTERLRRFFVGQGGGSYQISKAVRDLCVFARQDVTRDPPFSRLDLLSCRNMLIYLGASLQKRVIPFFHYALKRTGFLMLGSSESVERYGDLFAPVDKKNKIYSKLGGAEAEHTPFAFEGAHPKMDASRQFKETTDAGTGEDVGKAADRILLAKYVPAGIVVNARGQVIEVRGETGPYLRPAPGKLSPSMLKLVREDLIAALDAVVREARKTGTRVCREGVRFKFEDRVREVEIEAVPISASGGDGRHFLVLFKESAPWLPPASGRAPKKPRGTSTSGGDERDREIEQLKAQLGASREYQQSVIDKLDAGNEELRSSSEEALSANEELRSTNEELETAKEELQSANEELTTLNDELQHKNLDLGQLNSDLANVIAGVNIPLVIVDANLRLRRFSPQAEKLLSVVAGDVGRKIGDFKSTVKVPDLERVLLSVLESLTPVEQEVQDAGGRWYSMRVRPYRTPDNRIEGTLIVFLDIDALKISMIEIEEGRAFREAILDSARDPFLILDQGLFVKGANRAFYETFRVGKEETENVHISDLGTRQWNLPRLRELLEDFVQRDVPFKDLEIEHEFPKIGRKAMLLHARRVAARPGRPLRVLVTIEDVTETRHEMAARLLQSAVVDSSQDAIITMSPERAVMSWNGAAVKMFGYRPEEILGRPISILIPPDRTDEEAKIQRAIGRGEKVPTYDSMRRRKDGTLVDVAITVSPLIDPSGKILGASKIVRDISARIGAEEQIRAANDSLERRVRARTAELEATLKQLDTFTYTVSHDLRAPLRAMNSYSQILIEDYAGKVLDETAQDYARRVAESARRMDKLVQDLLDYSRLTRSEIPIERVDLRGLLAEVLKGMEREIFERKARVDIEEPLPAVQGHRATLAQVLTNLLSNATKFVAPGVVPHIRVRAQPLDNWVRVWVEDNGIGIPAEHHERIFGVFQHLHRQEEYSGTGIGLAIVTKAMERMGGRVGLESQVGKGSRFWVELPRGKP